MSPVNLQLIATYFFHQHTLEGGPLSNILKIPQNPFGGTCQKFELFTTSYPYANSLEQVPPLNKRCIPHQSTQGQLHPFWLRVGNSFKWQYPGGIPKGRGMGQELQNDTMALDCMSNYLSRNSIEYVNWLERNNLSISICYKNFRYC